MDLKENIERFITEQSWNKSTEKRFRVSMNAYCKSFDFLSLEFIRKFLEKRFDEISPYGSRNDAQSIRQFTEWLCEEGIIRLKEWGKIKRYLKSYLARCKSKQEPAGREISKDELGKLFCTGNASTRYAFRFMYLLGLRSVEIENLCLRDLDFEEGRVKLIGKKGKIRYAPLSSKWPEILILIQKWLKIRKGLGFDMDPNSPVFPTQMRNAQNHESLGKFLRYHNFKFSTHSLRRTRITELINNGMDITLIAELVGHEDIKTTLKIYDKTSISRKLEKIAESITSLD